MANYTLLTGATGLLGRYLLRNLLDQGVPVAVVVRPTEHATAEDRVEAVLRTWGVPPSLEPACLEGDVRSAGLGLDKEARSWVRQHCDRVIHGAALLKLAASSDGEPEATNVHGTQHLLDLCRETEIRDFHHISTAYVSGRRQGTILESELDEGQEFRNDYEESKFRAERLVRAADHLDQVTIYRPAVISGDSVTGYTSTYHGLYLYLRLMAMLVPTQPVGEDGRRHTPIRLPMSGDEPRNVVPVDWVAAAMTHLLGCPDAHGRTYHLAPQTPLTPRQIIDACARYFNSSGVEYVGVGFRHDPADMSSFERLLLENMTIYDPYSTTDPVFDTSTLFRFAGHLPCPVIDEAMIHRYLDFAQADRWGRRRT